MLPWPPEDSTSGYHGYRREVTSGLPWILMLFSRTCPVGYHGYPSSLTITCRLVHVLKSGLYPGYLLEVLLPVSTLDTLSVFYDNRSLTLKGCPTLGS